MSLDSVKYARALALALSRAERPTHKKNDDGRISFANINGMEIQSIYHNVSEAHGGEKSNISSNTKASVIPPVIISAEGETARISTSKTEDVTAVYTHITPRESLTQCELSFLTEALIESYVDRISTMSEQSLLAFLMFSVR